MPLMRYQIDLIWVDMYNGAIIGFGAVAENAHVPAFKKRRQMFNIVAVADANPKRLKIAKKLFPKARLYKTDNELFAGEKNLHFVDIATPPTFHYKIIVKAFKENLHVLCEKPLVFKLSEFNNLVKIAAKKKRCLFTVHNWKHAPPIVKVKQLIDKGMLGDINHVELGVLRSQPSVTADKKDWRSSPKLSGGGIFTDHGWHNLYLAYHLTGNKKPCQITANLSYPPNNNTTENQAQVLINFKNATSAIHLTWKSPVRDNFIFIHGDKAVAKILDDKVLLLQKNKPPKIYKTKEKLSAGSAHPTWMVGMLDEFAKGLKNPLQRTGNLSEAKICLNLLQAGYKSARTNKTVKLKI
ncbi:MAG TPA: Gfo/Idh/MocA family oxidoreductase [Elusimicrobiales bacterium]|nr:Gfo/Idh/MocA family oxidoreductase [Elusimicrobiales bacterium]